MIDTKRFGDELKSYGFELFTGVPCSYLKYLINYSVNNCRYIPAVNEGDAAAIASGASIGGKKSVVLMQNSGLTNAMSPLVSLNFPFKIPLLGFVGLRGERGVPDEPQHSLIGEITPELLKNMKINWEFLSFDMSEASQQLEKANRYIENNQSFFFVVRKGTFAAENLVQNSAGSNSKGFITQKKEEDQCPERYQSLQVINHCKTARSVLVATTGMTGRELYDIEDAPNHLYMVGSMGCAASLGLGLAITRQDKDIIVIDGDGALLMRMGSLTTLGACRPDNLLHILLDNNSYDSTGGQLTVSNNADFVGIAAACGYKHSIYVHNLEELQSHIKEWQKRKGLTFLYIKIAQGSKDNVGRPKITPEDVKLRLMRCLK